MVTVKSNLEIFGETSIPYDTAKQDKNEQLLSMTLSRDPRYLNFSGESRGEIRVTLARKYSRKQRKQ